MIYRFRILDLVQVHLPNSPSTCTIQHPCMSGMCQVMYSSLLRELVRLLFCSLLVLPQGLVVCEVVTSFLNSVASSVEFNLQLNSVASSLQNYTLRRGEAGEA